MSIRLVRISLALKRVFSSAGIAPQAMPPTTPVTSIAGNRNGLVLSWKKIAIPPPRMAPTVYCPSAPIFHTLARKPSDKPIPMSTRGDALTTSSVTPSMLVTGKMKKV